MNFHREMMQLALREAKKAMEEGEIPVGAVVTKNGQIVACAHNLREKLKDPTAHAEILAIRKAAEKLGTRRLDGCTLYVTLEPCPMCAGALVMASIEKCFFAARDERQGCAESIYSLTNDPAFYHRLPCIGGLMELEAAELLQKFFAEKRQRGETEREH